MPSWMQFLLDSVGTKTMVFIISMIPLVELRGAIPVGVALGLSPTSSAVLSILGGMAPMPFILFGVRPVFEYLKGTRLFRRLVQKLTTRSLDKHGPTVRKYGPLGLLFFVAIPLPGTGVWSASLIAALLGIRFKVAFPAILVGNIVAGVIVALVSGGVVTILAH